MDQGSVKDLNTEGQSLKPSPWPGLCLNKCEAFLRPSESCWSIDCPNTARGLIICDVISTGNRAAVLDTAVQCLVHVQAPICDGAERKTYSENHKQLWKPRHFLCRSFPPQRRERRCNKSCSAEDRCLTEQRVKVKNFTFKWATLTALCSSM